MKCGELLPSEAFVDTRQLDKHPVLSDTCCIYYSISLLNANYGHQNHHKAKTAIISPRTEFDPNSLKTYSTLEISTASKSAAYSSATDGTYEAANRSPSTLGPPNGDFTYVARVRRSLQDQMEWWQSRYVYETAGYMSCVSSLGMYQCLCLITW